MKSLTLDNLQRS